MSSISITVQRLLRLNNLACIFWLTIALAAAATADSSIAQFEVESDDNALRRNVELHLSRARLNPNALEFRNSLSTIIERSTQALGYYTASHKVNEVDDNHFRIVVEAGTPVRWDSPRIVVTGSAAALADIDNAIKRSKIVANEPLSHQVYEDSKKGLLDTCHSNGYLDASFSTSSLLIDPVQQLAIADLVLDCGAQYSLSSIVFNGSEVEDTLLRQLSGQDIGQPYRRKQLRTLYQRLSETGYFKSIDIERKIVADENVILEVKLADVVDARILAGIGYGTDTGPRASLQWDKSLLNKRGHSAFSQLEVSRLTQSLEAQYRIPAPHPLYDFYDIQLGAQHKDIQNKTLDTASLGFSWNRHFPHTWHRILSLELQHEASQIDGERKETDNFLLPSVHWSRSDDSEFSFLSAYRLWAAFTLGPKVLGTDIDFLHINIGAKYLLPIVKHHSLLLRGELGSIITGDIEQVPLSQRFYSGGDQTVRGYEYESIGRAFDIKALEGGKHLNVASIEYLWEFIPQWQSAVFLDTGRAYDDSSDTFYSSAGIGLRWNSPLGQLQLDIAKPINIEKEDPLYEDFRLHLFLGTSL